jgi:hypothetical protein
MDPLSAIVTLGKAIYGAAKTAGAVGAKTLGAGKTGAGAAAAGASAGVGAGAAKGAKLAQMLANVQSGIQIGQATKDFLAEPPSAPIATGRGGVNYGNEVDRLRNKGLL